MEGESLAGLKTAFEQWRSTKRHAREPVPAPLLKRARAAARRHGPGAAARATKVDRRRLGSSPEVSRAKLSAPASAARVPAFSRIELAAPSTLAFAELEMANGLKVRLFTPTREAIELLSSLLSDAGGVR